MYKAIIYLALIAASSAQFLPNGCPSNFDEHLLLPHESDCAKYYSCSNGNKIEKNCPPGLLFDVNLQLCNWPFEVQCTMPSPQPTTTTEAPTSTSTTSTTTEAIDLLPNGCPANFSIPYFLPHPTDCSRYYQCSNGNPIEMPCAPGTLFDYEEKICNWPWMVTCYPGATTPPPTSSTSTTTIDPTTTTESTVELLPNGCPVDFSKELLLPHESDCAKFYQCTHGNKVEMNCAPGTWFDFELQVCSWPFMVQCNVTTTTLPPTTTTTTATEEPTTTSTSEDITTTTEEPTTTTTTEEPSTTTTTTEGPGFLPNGCPADFSQNLLLPHESDCGKFYQCMHGNKMERNCTTGTWFDFELQACSWPFMVQCNVTTTTLPPTTTTTEDSTTTTEEPTTTTTTEDPSTTTTTEEITTTTTTTTEEPTTTTTEEPTTTTTTTEEPTTTTTEEPTTTTTTEEPSTTTTEGSSTTTSTTEEPKTTTEGPGFLPNGCPADFSQDLLLPHESDCGKFYQCIHGNKVTMNCPPGLWFDFELQMCNWPFIVQCNITTTLPPTTTTTTEDSTTTTTEGSSTTTSTTEEPTTTTEGPGFLPNGCPADFSQNLLLPHESDCGKFYQCTQGNKLEMNCPSGLWFYFELQLCDWPLMLQCNITTILPPTTTTTPEDSTTPTEEPSTTTEEPSTTTEEHSTTTEEPSTPYESTLLVPQLPNQLRETSQLKRF